MSEDPISDLIHRIAQADRGALRAFYAAAGGKLFAVCLLDVVPDAGKRRVAVQELVQFGLLQLAHRRDELPVFGPVAVVVDVAAHIQARDQRHEALLVIGGFGLHQLQAHVGKLPRPLGEHDTETAFAAGIFAQDFLLRNRLVHLLQFADLRIQDPQERFAVDVAEGKFAFQGIFHRIAVLAQQLVFFLVPVA